MRVIASAGGHCPSCRMKLPGSDEAIKSVPPTESDATVANTAHHASLPPEKLGQPVNDDRPTHFDLFWLLFSMRGRIPRSIFWLASIGGPVMLYLIFGFAQALFSETSLLEWIELTVYCAMIWMSIAVGVKRLHDLNWTGWLVLIGLIPALGQLFVLFTAGMMRGTKGRNNHGPDPLELLK